MKKGQKAGFFASDKLENSTSKEKGGKKRKRKKERGGREEESNSCTFRALSISQN